MEKGVSDKKKGFTLINWSMCLPRTEIEEKAVVPRTHKKKEYNKNIKVIPSFFYDLITVSSSLATKSFSMVAWRIMNTGVIKYIKNIIFMLPSYFFLLSFPAHRKYPFLYSVQFSDNAQAYLCLYADSNV